MRDFSFVAGRCGFCADLPRALQGISPLAHFSFWCCLIGHPPIANSCAGARTGRLLTHVFRLHKMPLKNTFASVSVPWHLPQCSSLCWRHWSPYGLMWYQDGGRQGCRCDNTATLGLRMQNDSPSIARRALLGSAGCWVLIGGNQKALAAKGAAPKPKTVSLETGLSYVIKKSADG